MDFLYLTNSLNAINRFNVQCIYQIIYVIHFLYKFKFSIVFKQFFCIYTVYILTLVYFFHLMKTFLYFHF